MRRIGAWLGESGGGLYILTGDARTPERVAEVTGRQGIDVTGLDVADCVRALVAELGLPPTGRMSGLVAALSERDGGDVTVALHNLDSAGDPDGVAGTVARRLAAEPGVRVVVSMRSGDDRLLTLLGPATVDDRTLWTHRWCSRRDPARLTRLTGHRAYVRALATLVLPGGRPLVASGCEDGDIRLWNPLAAEQFGAAFAAHADGVRALATLRVDATDLLVSGGSDGMARIWAPDAGRIVGEFDNGTAVRALAVVPSGDGPLIAVAGGTRVRLWNPAANTVERELTLVKGEIVNLAVHTEGGRVLLSCGVYSGLRSTWDTATGELLAACEDAGDTVAAVGSLLATGGPGGRARLWDPATGEHLRDAAGHHRGWRKGEGGIEVMTAATLRSGRTRLVTAGSDHTVRLWDTETGADEGGVIIDGKGLLQSLSPVRLTDGRVLLAASSHQDVWLWDTAHAAPTGHPHAVTSIATGGDGTLTSTDLYEVHRWDAATGAPLGVFVPEDVDTVQHAFVLADGRTLAADRHFKTRVWDPATGERVSVIPAPFARHLRMPDGGDRLASAASYLNPSADDDPPVRLWDPVSGAETASISWPDGRIRVVRAVPRPDGAVWLACRTDAKDVLFFDASTGEQVGARLPDEVGDHWSVGVLPTGLFVTGADDGTLYLWDPATGEPAVPPLPGRGHVVRAVAGLPAEQGMWLAAGGDDDAVSLWVLDGGEAVRVDEIPVGARVRTLTVLPDGGLAVGTEHGLQVLDVHTDRETHPLPAPVAPVAEEPVAVEPQTVDPGTGTWTVAWTVGHEGLALPTSTTDGRVLAVGAADRIHVHHADGTSFREPLQGPESTQALTTVDIDGRIVVAAYGGDGTVDEEENEGRAFLLWDLETGEPAGDPIAEQEFGEYDLDVTGLAPSTDGSCLVGVAGNEWGATGYAWDLGTRALRHAFSIESVSDVYTQALLPFAIDGRAAVVGTFSDFDQEDEEKILVAAFDLETGDAVGRPWHLDNDQDHTAAAITVLNGRPTLAAWVPGDKIRLRRVLDGAPVAALDTSDVGPVTHLAAGTVDGTPVLAAAHTGGTVTVWDLDAKRRIVTAETAGVTGMAFTPGGLLVLAGGEGLVGVEVAHSAV